jgi:hypothetical protein
MTTKRTPINRTGGHRITPQALDAFQCCDRLALHRALGLRPWQPSPLDAVTVEPPAWAGECEAWRQSWPLARELRASLEQQKIWR